MNPEQIKIISVVVGTLLVAIILDNVSSGSAMRSKSSAVNYLAQSGTDSKSPSKKSNTSSSKPACRKKGINLYGKVQFVDSFPDLTIQYVSSFPDINVEFVSSFPSSCGQWEEVDSFPDFKVQVVSSFPDLKVKKVSSFPGME
jgi:hypothetical protein